MTGVRTTDPETKRKGEIFGRENAGFSVLLILTAFVAGALAFAGMLALNAYSSYETIGTTAETLLAFYRTGFQVDYVFYLTEYSVVECFIIVILAAFLIMSFWNRKKEQNVSPWICLMLLLAPTPLTVQGVLPYQVYSVFIWGVLAGIGVQQSFVWESTAFAKERSFTESVPAPVEFPDEKPRFLENPLPLPRKHEKRTLDYQYEVVEEQMEFDLEIDENDDFDIR